LVAKVDAAYLEEAARAMRMFHARENRIRPRAVIRLAVGDEVARAPAQEWRDVVRPQARHHERAGLAFLHRLERIRIQHLDEVQVAPDAKTEAGLVLRAHHSASGHAERAGELRATG